MWKREAGGEREELPRFTAKKKNPPSLSLRRSHAGKDFHEGGQAGGAPEAAAHQGAHPDVSRCVSTHASATIWTFAAPPATGPQATAHLLGLAKPAGRRSAGAE